MLLWLPSVRMSSSSTKASKQLRDSPETDVYEFELLLDDVLRHSPYPGSSPEAAHSGPPGT